jgi:hypothetical protein
MNPKLRYRSTLRKSVCKPSWRPLRSLFAFDHTGAITLSEGKALSRTSGSNPGQLTRAVSGRTKWWPGGAPRFHFAFPVRPRRKSTQDLSLARGLLTRTSGRENRYQSIITEPYQSMIAFPRRAPHAYLMECRQERTALADEPQPRRECVSRIGMNYLSDGHIDFRN